MNWYKDSVNIDGVNFSFKEVVNVLRDKVTEERFQKLLQIVSQRSNKIVTVTEALHDRGNLSAVMRSTEAFGFYDFRIIENPDEKFKVANRASMGTDKWLKISKYRHTIDAVKELKTEGYRILTTDLDSRVSIHEVDFSIPSAIVFGNEKMGISQEMKRACDLSFKIPMLGFAQSFNISVAAALSLQTARLQIEKDFALQTPEINLNTLELTANYLLRSVDRSQDILYHSRRQSLQPLVMQQSQSQNQTN